LLDPLGLDGLEGCRRARARTDARPLYIILLTARTDRQGNIDGLTAGADDFVTKPFDAAEPRPPRANPPAGEVVAAKDARNGIRLLTGGL
jgi:CheY-like chemotaxis protein